MSELQASEIEELRNRLARLEYGARSQRGCTNQTGAARYLGKSDEWLRRQHLLGRGPRRKRSGTRNWSYSYVDLDAFPETTKATP